MARPVTAADHVTVIVVVPTDVQTPSHISWVAGVAFVSTFGPATRVHVVALPPESDETTIVFDATLEKNSRMSPMADVAVRVRVVVAVPVLDLSVPLAVTGIG